MDMGNCNELATFTLEPLGTSNKDNEHLSHCVKPRENVSWECPGLPKDIESPERKEVKSLFETNSAIVAIPEDSGVKDLNVQQDADTAVPEIFDIGETGISFWGRYKRMYDTDIKTEENVKIVFNCSVFALIVLVVIVLAFTANPEMA